MEEEGKDAMEMGKEEKEENQESAEEKDWRSMTFLACAAACDGLMARRRPSV
jgi:hypothetical protein